jgi:DNA polymerase-3 subunit delta
VKYNTGQIESFIKKPSPDIKAVLFYGPNEGLVNELYTRCAKAIVPDLSDPFLVVDINTDVLSDEPSKIADEAASISLMGGRKVIRIRDAGNTITAYLKTYFENPIGDALIVISAGNLKPTSSLRKLFEKEKIAIATPCYEDEASTIADIISASARENGKNIDRDALEFLVSHFGSDRKSTRAEMEKLLLYVGKDSAITLEHVKACIGDSSTSSMDDFAYFVTEGRPDKAVKSLEKLSSENIPAVIVLRALSNHFIKMQLISSKMSSGMSFDVASRGIYPPIHFKKTNRFRNILNIWRTPYIVRAISQLQKAEIDAKTTGFPADAVCSRLFLQLAHFAQRLSQRR